MDGSVQEKHGFQELDSLKAAIIAHKPLWRFLGALVSTAETSCGALGYSITAHRVYQEC